MLYPQKGHIFCSPGNEGGSQALQACLVPPPLSFCGRWQSSHRAFILEQPLSSAWWVVVASSISLEAPTPKMPLLLPEAYTLLLRYVLRARKGNPSHSVSGHPHPSLQRDRTCRAPYLWYLLMSWELCIADWLFEPWSRLPSPQALWTHENIPFWCFFRWRRHENKIWELAFKMHAGPLSRTSLTKFLDNISLMAKCIK